MVPMAGSTPTNIPNFGWPCYEGDVVQQAFDRCRHQPVCGPLRARGRTAPVYAYTHVGTLTPKGPASRVPPTRRRRSPGSRSTRAHRAARWTTRAKYDGALFFVDYSRDCLGGDPAQGQRRSRSGKVEQIASGIANPVDLVRGPGGDLFYVDHEQRQRVCE